MARNKSPVAIGLEYYSLRGLMLLLRTLPFSWSRQLARWMLRGILQFLPKRRRMIIAQMTASFPDYSPAAVDALAASSLDYLADGVAAFARIETLQDRDLDQWVVARGFEHMQDAFRHGRGLIIFTGHIGCWELMARYVTSRLPQLTLVVRPLDNPRLDAMVARIRGLGGGSVMDSRRVFKDGLRLLRRNGMLGILIDQNFHKGGIFVDFFNRPAATNTLVPILARRTGCVVVPLHNVWRDGKIVITCEPPVVFSTNPDPATALAEDTQQLTGIVEKWIREDPSQWLWLHNRWKRRPEPGDIVYAKSPRSPAATEGSRWSEAS
jgi:KDO2-lipid IV(A) lauroyltransferase